VKRLVELSFTPDGAVNEAVVRVILERLGRSDLKRYRAALLREMRRRSVRVTVEGGSDRSVDDAMRERFPGRQVEIGHDPALGAGVRLTAGDDVEDASVMGYVRTIIEQLGAP
jgi:hypothetical protein